MASITRLDFFSSLSRKSSVSSLGTNLRRKAESVPKPAAPGLLTPVGKFFPELVHLFLRLAVHNKGNGLAELEPRSPLSATNSSPSNRKLMVIPGTCLPVARNFHNPRIFKDRDIEIGRFLRVVIKPEKWCDLSHRCLLP